jgi:hypothetical protein
VLLAEAEIKGDRLSVQLSLADLFVHFADSDAHG